MEDYEDMITEDNNNISTENLTDNNGDPNVYSVLNEGECTAIATQGPAQCLLGQQITKKPENFADLTSKAFAVIARNNIAQAERLYFVAMEIALNEFGGDVEKLAAELGNEVDVRDIIMADYEFKIRNLKGVY